MLTLLSAINYLAVLVAALSGMIVSGLWYHQKVMGRAWMAEMGYTEKDLGNPAPAMLKAFLANIVLAFGLATFFLLLQIPGIPMSMLDGAGFGFGLAVLVHGAAAFPNYVFENRTPMHFLIHVGNSALGMAVMGAILVAWR